MNLERAANPLSTIPSAGVWKAELFLCSLILKFAVYPSWYFIEIIAWDNSGIAYQLYTG